MTDPLWARSVGNRLKNLESRLENLEQSLQAVTVGMNNVYGEFKKFSVDKAFEKIDEVNKRLDHYRMDQSVDSFHVNVSKYYTTIRVHFSIKTNFGNITQTIDYPPQPEYRMGPWLAQVYKILLSELFDAHEKRGGQYLGEEGFKEFLDTYGETVVELPSILFNRDNR